ncbi:MAG: hypothetical protein CMJ49_00895 [Planctomycetaceae bacterium]|nr:hypothetical protein [Planctomycetaceae bacterium]
MVEATTAPPETGSATSGAPAVQAALENIAHIATLPEITVKIIDLVENPESTARDLHQVIENDPALCARILKVVNSAFYGLPGQIGSINRAIVLLGLNAVKNIAIAVSLTKLFSGSQVTPTFSARDLWVHSICVGVGSRLLSGKIGLRLPPDEAFLGGLMHDIGIMVELQADRAKLLAMLDQHQQGKTFLDAEQQVFGADHQQFGQGLCEKWKFPSAFSFVTGYHHQPLALDAESRTLTALVYVADRLAVQGGFGYTGTVADTDIDTQVLDALKLTEHAIEEVREELPEAIEVAEQLTN